MVKINLLVQFTHLVIFKTLALIFRGEKGVKDSSLDLLDTKFFKNILCLCMVCAHKHVHVKYSFPSSKWLTGLVRHFIS